VLDSDLDFGKKIVSVANSRGEAMNTQGAIMHLVAHRRELMLRLGGGAVVISMNQWMSKVGLERRDVSLVYTKPTKHMETMKGQSRPQHFLHRLVGKFVVRTLSSVDVWSSLSPLYYAG